MYLMVQAYWEKEGCVGIVDGILTYHNPTFKEILDVELFLWASKVHSRTRRL